MQKRDPTPLDLLGENCDKANKPLDHVSPLSFSWYSKRQIYVLHVLIPAEWMGYYCVLGTGGIKQPHEESDKQ